VEVAVDGAERSSLHLSSGTHVKEGRGSGEVAFLLLKLEFHALSTGLAKLLGDDGVARMVETTGCGERGERDIVAEYFVFDILLEEVILGAAVEHLRATHVNEVRT
jgi:hypothetical protein